ncbi:MAG TPA: hypothetical protein VK974_09945 [Methylophilaceae bacterium]|nr:hypothetical protein [Methylophilaceae bacterium]
MKFFKTFLFFGVVLSTLLAPYSAIAALPKSKSVETIRLGMGAEQALSELANVYVGCDIAKVYHKEIDSEAAGSILSEIAVETGELGKIIKKSACNNSDVIDKLNLKFLNSESDFQQPVYEIAFLRFYGDPEFNTLSPIKYQFEGIRKALFDKYGSPSGQLRVKTSVNQPASKKGKKPDVLANDYESFNITYVWGGRGLRAQTLTYCMENCGDYYLIANLNIVKRKNLLPRNTFYVRSISLKLVDSLLEEKQFDWSYKRLKRPKGDD